MSVITTISFKMAKAKEASSQLASIVESSDDAIIGMSLDGVIISCNPAAQRIYGYSADEVGGGSFAIMLPPENADEMSGIIERIARGESVEQHETVHVTKNGRRIYVSLTISPTRDATGNIVGISMIARDITERKRAEQALAKAHEELREQMEYIKKAQEQLIHSEKMASLGLLTAGVSHEILNPLNGITLSLYMLINDPDTPPGIASELRDVREQANRITKIAQDLLYYARQRPPERSLLDFNETVKRTLSLLEPDLRLGNIALELSLAERLPPVSADLDQLQQVVFNLLTNARDAMPQGGRLVLRTDAVQKDGEKFVELRVEDTGSGIAPEHMDKLFDPFFTTKPEGKGTGLGLAICHGIVEAHGGTIWAENAPEGGAAFVVRLSAEEG